MRCDTCGKDGFYSVSVSYLNGEKTCKHDGEVQPLGYRQTAEGRQAMAGAEMIQRAEQRMFGG